ncbi:hypothetical protein B0O40_0260 [Ruminococcaceae bacterium R-25]|nr:hypothetical protein B0O40_0260 [Ruminococcaceae bacterium R-25]SUQ10905.1 hypothetical protein SAMN06297423_0260 [Oscillospiraceae bacterium]
MEKDLRKALTSRLDILDKLAHTIERKITSLPHGRIEIKHAGQKVYYYLSESNTDGMQLCKDNALVSQLAQKNYLEKVLKSTSQEAAILQRALRQYPETIAEEIYDKLTEDRKSLVKPIVTPLEQFVNEWQEKPFTKKAIKEGVPYFTTLRGEKVRSKSEQIIADRLYIRGIPYKYECPLKVGNKVIHPDFTILRRSDRKEIYLEHLGMSDDDKYLNDNVPRLNEYILNGYMPGDRLFLTFESSKTPLNTDVIDKMIDKLFL